MAKREYENPIEEILDRTRRMETKMTKLLDYSGLNTDGLHPKWEGGALSIPTVSITVKDALDHIPLFWPEPVPLICDGVIVGYLRPSTISER